MGETFSKSFFCSLCMLNTDLHYDFDVTMMCIRSAHLKSWTSQSQSIRFLVWSTNDQGGNFVNFGIFCGLSRFTFSHNDYQMFWSFLKLSSMLHFWSSSGLGQLSWSLAALMIPRVNQQPGIGHEQRWKCPPTSILQTPNHKNQD